MATSQGLQPRRFRPVSVPGVSIREPDSSQVGLLQSPRSEPPSSSKTFSEAKASPDRRAPSRGFPLFRFRNKGEDGFNLRPGCPGIPFKEFVDRRACFEILKKRGDRDSRPIKRGRSAEFVRPDFDRFAAIPIHDVKWRRYRGGQSSGRESTACVAGRERNGCANGVNRVLAAQRS